MRLIFIILCFFTVNFLLAQMPKDLISVEDAAFNDYYLNPDNVPTVTGKYFIFQKGNIKRFEFYIP